ncbi:L,D-transpeptidase [Pseudonocardia sp. HH130629-09]|uniref:L,D-transpeptidase n=1 Tax=Pseudonocardia sp. HH130629-09 TaxID=1641402 RepID=UPI0006CB2D9D|nr:Ig-like domain-containing protein [Pseudonocardia sp. HH130629-09]ALE85533.1 L,D-transpeptidase [Pseudonocardia sp. HH130629-09]
MRRVLIVVVALIGALGIVGAVALAASPQDPAAPQAAPPPAGPQVSYQPPVRSAGGAGTDTVSAATANPAQPVSVRTAGGTLDGVSLTDPYGDAVDGALSPDRTTWTSSGDLDFATTYTWHGRAVAPDGTATPVQGTVATLKPAHTVRGTLNIGDDRTVGIAAPIEIQFDRHVQDRAAIEKVLKVTTSKQVEGAWGWLPDENGGSRVHWRPKEYWPSGTKVTVDAPLKGVDYGGGSYGAEDLSTSFTIGRAQIVKADARSFRMIVIRDGKQVADYPASYGLADDPNRNTRSGIHVVTEKFTDKRMVSAQYGYDVVEKWAVRMSNNGEFIHANPVSAAAQGTANVTHGCVNLSIENAKAYYDTVLYGDPVEVTGTPVQLSARDGDLWDWTLSWDKWKGLSALS